MFAFIVRVSLHCYFATYASGYCGFYNQVVALVSLTRHMFMMSPIIAECPFRISEYSVSWSRVVGSIAALISPQAVIFSVFTNYPLSAPTYFSLIPSTSHILSHSPYLSFLPTAFPPSLLPPSLG